MNHSVNEDCIFCRIIQGDIPSKTVYEDDNVKAIMDVAPASKGHIIILPKNHAANIFELSDADASNIFIVAKRIATAVQEEFQCEGINILQNNGEAAGQTVFHLHVHVIPRYKDDTVNIKWLPNTNMELDTIARTLKTRLQG